MFGHDYVCTGVLPVLHECDSAIAVDLFAQVLKVPETFSQKRLPPPLLAVHHCPVGNSGSYASWILLPPSNHKQSNFFFPPANGSPYNRGTWKMHAIGSLCLFHWFYCSGWRTVVLWHGSFLRSTLTRSGIGLPPILAAMWPCWILLSNHCAFLPTAFTAPHSFSVILAFYFSSNAFFFCLCSHLFGSTANPANIWQRRQRQRPKPSLRYILSEISRLFTAAVFFL